MGTTRPRPDLWCPSLLHKPKKHHGTDPEIQHAHSIQKPLPNQTHGHSLWGCAPIEFKCAKCWLGPAHEHEIVDISIQNIRKFKNHTCNRTTRELQSEAESSDTTEKDYSTPISIFRKPDPRTHALTAQTCCFDQNHECAAIT